MKEVPVEVPMSFSIPQGDELENLDDFDNLARLLQPSLVGVPVPDNTERVGFQDSLGKLLNAAAIIRAVHFEEASLDGIGERMKELAVRALNFEQNGGNTPDPENGDGTGENDFDLFLDRVERGFIDEPGISDGVNPYGRDFERRPRIRKIGEGHSDTP
jgi:hypothetical protein